MYKKLILLSIFSATLFRIENCEALHWACWCAGGCYYGYNGWVSAQKCNPDHGDNDCKNDIACEGCAYQMCRDYE